MVILTSESSSFLKPMEISTYQQPIAKAKLPFKLSGLPDCLHLKMLLSYQLFLLNEIPET